MRSFDSKQENIYMDVYKRDKIVGLTAYSKNDSYCLDTTVCYYQNN